MKLKKKKMDRQFGSSPVNFEHLESRMLLSTVNVYTYHNDAQRTGQNNNETILTPGNVNVNTFGKVGSYAVDGQVYAQPLYVTGLTVNSATHNVLFVATEHDSLYALDADTGATLWKDSYTNPAAGINTIPWQDTTVADINPEIGITGTPVIDPSTNILYVVVRTKETQYDALQNPTGYAYVQKLHALNLSDGTEAVAPKVIVGPGAAPVTVSGTGTGSVGGKLTFDGLIEAQRPGLLLKNGTVYVAWASHGDNGNYHGWVMGFSASTLAMQYQYVSTPNGDDGGIWMSGGAPSTDGTDIFLSVGNGKFDANTGGLDYADSALKLASDLSTVKDYFRPNAENPALDNDFGSTGQLVIPDQPSSTPHLLFSGAKTGDAYLINRDGMGGFNAATDQNVATAHNVGRGFFTAAYFNGHIYFATQGGSLFEYALNNPSPTLPTQLALASQSNITFGFPGSTPSISSNNGSNGIVWALDTSGFGAQTSTILRAFDASNVTTELYDSTQYQSRDAAAAAIKFDVPTVANGKVFVGGAYAVTVYGLLPPPTQPPATPASISAAAASNTQVNVAWSDSLTETGVDLYRSVDGGAFSPVTAQPLPAATVNYKDTNVSQGHTYSYEVRALNAAGASAFTAPVSATTNLPTQTTYVSDLAYTTVANGYGPVKNDLSNGGNTIAGAGNTLTLNGVTYTKGLGAHAISEVDVNLAGTYTKFVSDVGVDDEVGSLGTVDFKVVADGVTLFDSGVMTGSSATQTINVDVTGKNKLRLIVGDAGDGINSDHADWAGARLLSAGVAAPVAPTTFTAVAQSAGSISLSWNDVAGEQGFKIERSPDNGGATNTDWVQIGSPQIAPYNTTVGPGVLTYLDTNLAGNTTYYYRIRATNSGGNSPYSAAIASATTLLAAPVTPTNATATAVSATQINLTWQDNSNNEDNFQIYRKDGPSGTFNLIATLPAVTANAPSTVHYTDNANLQPNTAYDYHIEAWNAAGHNDFAGAAVTTPAAGVPFDLAIHAGGGAVSSFVADTDFTGGSTFATTSPVDTSQITNPPTASVFQTERWGANFSYAIPGLTPNSAYTVNLYFAELYFDGGGMRKFNVAINGTQVLNNLDVFTAAGGKYKAIERTFAATADANGLITINFTGVVDNAKVDGIEVIGTTSATGVPATPTGFTAGAVTSGQVTLNWQDVSGEAGFKVLRSSTGAPGSFTVLNPTVAPNNTTVGTGVLTYTDTGLAPATTYYYELIATNNNGDSAPTAPLQTTTLAVPPATPVLSTVTPVSATQIKLTWQDVSGEAGFKVLRSATGIAGSFAVVAPSGALNTTVGANVLTFTDTGLSPSTTYYYELVASNAAGDSNPTAATSATTQALATAPATPVISTINALSASQIQLTWQDVANESGFKVLRATSPGGPFATVAPAGTLNTTVGAGVLTFTDTGLSPSTTYYYELVASNSVGDSPATAAVNAATQAAAAPSAYVSDLAYLAVSNGWGPVEKDTSNGEQAAGDGHTITLNGTTYAKGLGTHANSEVDVPLHGQWGTFVTDIGVDDEVGSNGSVIFKVLDENNNVLYTSPLMTGASATQHVNLSVGNKQTLKLIVNDGGNGNAYDHADWAGAKLLAPVNTAPAVPTNFAGNAISPTQVTLTWSDAAGEAGFKIQRSPDNGLNNDWAVVGTPVAPLNTTVAAGVLTYTDTNLTAGTTYYYRIAASNNIGDSAYTTPAISVATPAVSSQPVYVSDLPFVTVSNGWGPVEKDMSNGEQAAGDGHIITLNTVQYAKGLGTHANSEVDVNLGGAYGVFASDIGVDDEVGAHGSVVFQVWNGQTKLYDSGTMTGTSATKTLNIPVGGVQTLRLVVTDSGDGNAYDHADWANARLLPPANTVPAVPTGLAATPGSPTQISLSWNDAAGEAGFKIERATSTAGVSNNDWVQIGTPVAPYGTTVGVGVLTFSDSGLAANTQYFYRIRASNAAGDSAYNATPVSATTLALSSAPVYVSDLPFVAVTNGWGPVEKDMSNGEQSAGDGHTITINGFQYAKGLGTHANSEVDLNLGGAYTRFISDVGVDNEVGAHGTVDFQIYADGTLIFDSGVMKGLQTAQTVNKDVTGVQLLRLVVNDSGDGNSYDHADWAGARLLPVGAATTPTGLIATVNSAASITLNWSAVTGQGYTPTYELERSTDNLNFTQYAPNLAATTFTDVNLQPGVTYYYRVRQSNGLSGYSDYSAPASATTSTLPLQSELIDMDGPKVGAYVTDPQGLTSLGYTVTQAIDTSAVVNPAPQYVWQSERSGTPTYTFSHLTPGTPYVVQLDFAELYWNNPGQRLFNVSINNTQVLTNYDILASAGGKFKAVAPQFNTIADPNGNITIHFTNGSADQPAINGIELKAVDNTVPAAPTGLTAVANTGSEVDLAWNVTLTDQYEFLVRRSTDGTNFSTIGAVPFNVSTYKDYTAAGGTAYTYQVVAVNSAGNSLPSAPATATTAASLYTWSTAAANPQKVAEAQGAAVGNFLYEFGGFTSGAITATTLSQKFNPATNTWTTIAPMPEAITHAATVVDGTTIYLLGGFVGDSPYVTTNHVWKYDTVNNTWSAGVSLPDVRAAGTAGIIGRTLHYVGGVGADTTTGVGTHYTINLDTGTQWSTAAAMPEVRDHMGGGVINGKFYAVGGELNRNETDRNVDYLNAYDPLTNSWSTVSPMPAELGHINAGTLVIGSHLVMLGGETNIGTTTTGAYAYDPVSNTWSGLPQMPLARSSVVAGVVNGQLIASTGSLETGVVPTGDVFNTSAFSGL